MHSATQNSAQATLTQEWVCLQNNHERYEHSALIVKLAAVALFATGICWPHDSVLRPSFSLLALGVVECVLWLQESILRTNQARLGERLLRVEALQRSTDDNPMTANAALQLHTEWLADRAGVIGLLGEYVRHAIRPTVAFPYALLAALFALLAASH